MITITMITIMLMVMIKNNNAKITTSITVITNPP